MRRPFQLALIAVLVLAAYYPSITAGLCYIDDTGVMDFLLNRDEWDLRNIFFPGNSNGSYYRPLVMFSYVADRFIWFADERFMHLENIILHVVNASLVYVLALQVSGRPEKNTVYVPLVAALAFSLHPLNTESVSWICGRSDLLAAFFLFTCAIFLLKYRNSGGKMNLLLSLLAFVLAVLCKEISVAFIPGALLILDDEDTSKRLTSPNLSGKAFQPHMKVLLFVLAGIMVVLLILVLRRFASTSTDSGVGATISFIKTDPLYAIFMCFRATGFYLKKLFLPYPLNFAIIEADPLYELLAIPLIIVCWIIYLRRSLVSAIFVCGLLLITPSFLIAFNRIAWTSFAERYMYIPSGFIMISSVIYLNDLRCSCRSKILAAKAVPLLILATATAGTLHRNLIWHDSVALLRDSVQKTPDFHMLRNNYGLLLMDRGDLVNARTQFETAYSLFKNEEPLLNLGEVLNREGKPDEAIALYQQLLVKSRGASIRAHDHLVSLLEHQLLLVRSPEQIRTVTSHLLECYEYRAKFTKDAHSCYRMGQLSLALDDTKMAKIYFKEAHDMFPDGDPYKGYSSKLLKRLNH